MSVRSPGSTQPGRTTPESAAPQAYDYDAAHERGVGWVAFAGVLLVTLGTVNIIEGIAAISNAHFFVHNASYVFADLNTWGWIGICMGAIQLLAGLGVFIKNQWARWVGIVVLGLNAIAQLLMMPAYPFWALCLFAMDILAMYGLVAYGQRIGEDW